MTDSFSREERSRIMSRIRSRGNLATEMRFIEIARKYRITGWRRGSKLPGHPDFVFPRERVVVFIDGDFWHGNPKKFRIPKSMWNTGPIKFNQQASRSTSKSLAEISWVECAAVLAIVIGGR